MAQLKLASLGDLRPLVGTEMAASDWFLISQERIDAFATATDDLQWIHTDAARAAAESPYGGTVAHGFLTLSVLPHLMQQAIELSGVRMGINYGLNRVRFTGPVPAGARIRAHFTLARLEDLPGGVQTTWSVRVERESVDKPVLVAEWLTRRFE
ncbi:MAG: MaoC family dehydratase [Betaproteobacteria bacterium]|nr:MaoC family dehydratase [Betaproteobacteria bacterium]